MGRGRTQASAAQGIADAVVFSILLLVALWVLSVIFPSFAATFGFFNSLLFALAYLRGARGVHPGESVGRFPTWLGVDSVPASKAAANDEVRSDNVTVVVTAPASSS